eukprot:gene16004-19042_t
MEQVDGIREHVLRFFNAPYKQYTLIFTSGATDSLRKVGECFPWTPQSTFFHSFDAHNSLLGIREYAATHSAKTKAIPSSFFKRSPAFSDILSILADQSSNSNHPSLLAFPAQCNYSGSKNPLTIIKAIQQKAKNVKVLLDAASFVPTSPLDLEQYPADFVVLSFYKMFGYPTGIGALIIKNDKDVENGDSVACTMEEENIYLTEINVYPVKSFGPFTTDRWEIGPAGLLYDREWTLVDQNGVYINQKKLPILGQISTRIDLMQRLLVIDASEMPSLEIPLDYMPVSSLDVVQVCGDRVPGLLYGAADIEKAGDISGWMQRVTGKRCHLVRKDPDSQRRSRMASGESISFANESPFLLISNASVQDLKSRVVERNASTDASEWRWITADSFRANFVLAGGSPYHEDTLEKFSVGPAVFDVIGDCNRCKMICINQSMGVEEHEPLATLSTYRRKSGKIVFGQHLQYSGVTTDSQTVYISTGLPVIRL